MERAKSVANTALPYIGPFLLLGASLLSVLPVFSVPFHARIWYLSFSGTATSGRLVYGSYGYCAVKIDTVECSKKQWGYGMNLSDLGLPAGQLVRSRYTKPLGVVVPLCAALCLVALAMSVVQVIRFRRDVKRRSLPSGSHAQPTRPKLLIVIALITFLALGLSVGAVACAQLAFTNGRNNLNTIFGRKVAWTTGASVMSINAMWMLAIALVSQIVLIVRHQRFQRSLLRRADPSLVANAAPFDKRPDVDRSRKWQQMDDDGYDF